MPSQRDEKHQPFFLTFETEGKSASTCAILVIDESPIDVAVVRVTISTYAGIFDLDIGKNNLDAVIAELQMLSSEADLRAAETGAQTSEAPGDTP